MANESAAPRDNWEAHWARFAESATENPAQRMRHDLIAQLLSEKAGSGAIRLFDFGSGQGDLVEKLSGMFPNAEFVGAELSNSGVAISQRKVPVATFVVADILEAPAVLKNFAGWASHAVCSEVLEHVDDPAAFLRQAREYLVPGAQLIVTVPGGPISAFDREIGHRQHFNRGKIRSLLEEAGYLVERTYLAGFPFFNLYRLLVLMRGPRLARDIEATAVGRPSGLLRFAMKLFRVLFHANLLDSPFGWQVVAIARKPSP
ncbi:MAG TPA: class I SAM-dependent methyltransferase [Chthoniobacterales bacterium]|nr:class I SAM-dependent methyltransferase [Chthoniobacterales bacterium]